MHKPKNKITKWIMIEAIIIDLIVASIIVIAIISTINILFGKKIKKAINIIDMISISQQSDIIPEIKFDEKTNKIETRPQYGARYANLKIESLDISLPLYYGDKMSILRNGLGQSSGSYFPGEGGSIVCMGHNTRTFLYNLPKIKKDALIEVETTYGKYTYKVYETKVINMYNMEALPIQKNEEILMLYTCYPVNGLGHKTDRFVVYAKKI